jgi:excisionase family DNA binding protein
MSYTLGQAAKATGLSKSTIQRAIKGGRISGIKDEASDEWRIDPAELHRVYPPVAALDAARNGADTALRLEELRHVWERERLSMQQVIDDLRNRLNEADDERRTVLRQLTALLTDQRAKAPEVMVTPPPTSEAIITPPPPAADTAPAATPTPAPATQTRPNAAPVAVKVRPVKKPPAKETGWFRRMMGGR